MRALILSGLLLAVAGCSSPPPALKGAEGAPSGPPAPKSALEEVLSWLPGDTETLAAAQGPFKIEASEETDEDSEEQETFTLEDVFRGWTTGSIGAIREGRFFKPMADWSVKLAVEGSRRFRRPSGLGSFRYQGSSILLLEEGRGLDPLMKAIEKDAEEVFEERGHRVSVFREKLENDEWTFLVARPRPDVLLCATDRGYLGELLDRMAKPSKVRAFPPEIPEWKLLDSSARVWAIRHYGMNHSNPDEDVSPASLREDRTARGLVFFPSKEGRSGRVRVLSESARTFDEMKSDFHNPREGLSSSLEHENGIVEVTAACDSAKSASYFVLVLFAYLGHGINL
jgi:hypothetical protein